MRRLGIWLNREAEKRREEIIQEVTQGKFPNCKIRLQITPTECPHDYGRTAPSHIIVKLSAAEIRRRSTNLKIEKNSLCVMFWGSEVLRATLETDWFAPQDSMSYVKIVTYSDSKTFKIPLNPCLRKWLGECFLPRWGNKPKREDVGSRKRKCKGSPGRWWRKILP